MAVLKRSKNHRSLYREDRGFSTVGMVLALLISVSLLLSATQIYKIRSLASDVQNVADACALAAEKQIASFYIVAQVCDAAILSLSLAGLGVLGIGVVAACVPPLQTLSAELVQVGKSILDARTRFAHSCTESLNNLQKLLPLFAALDAAAVARANNSSATDYIALAYIVPMEAKDIELDIPDESVLSDIEAQQKHIAEAAQEAEEAAQQANAHKQRAFDADCGNNPSYCMYERAETLAGLSQQLNPYYTSVDTWSFAVALRRAQAYYMARSSMEQPASDAIEEQARSAIRSHFYAFATQELAQGYVHESEDSFEAYFPLLPRNTAEMRSSSLYTEEVYPVTEDTEGQRHMHAWSGCPCAGVESFVGYGSVAFLEAESLEICEACEFSASSVGKVASASTSIENGFEYHYCIVAQEAAAYEQERRKLSEQARGAKEPARSIFETLSELFKENVNCRIDIDPPGKRGAIAVVCDTVGVSVSSVVASSLVVSQASLGTRMAISAATLASDDAQEAETVISSLLDGVFQDVRTAALPSTVLDIWSSLLQAYSAGTSSIDEGIRITLDHLPLVGASGLGTWASDAFQDAITSAGLAPPNLVSYKPVLVNSYHVAAADEGGLSAGLLGAKRLAGQAFGGIASDPLSAVVSIAGGEILSRYDEWDTRFVIARIELFGSRGPSIPIEITLPPTLKDSGRGFIEGALDSMLMGLGSQAELQRWE